MHLQRHLFINQLTRATRAAGLAAIALAGCDSNSNTTPVGEQFKIAIAPITLAGIDDACYTISTYADVALNPVGWSPAAHASELVWTRTPVCASDFGIGTGGTVDIATTAIAYTGVCDASLQFNSVVLSLDNLYEGGHAAISQAGATGAGSALTVGTDYYNPCPASEPCILEAPCNPFQDSPVAFDLTVMRDGGKGFFDVSVQFEDIFCSAKFDCAYDNGDAISQVIGADGKKKATAVLGFACTAGTASASHLYMDDIKITCATGGINQTIDVSDSGGLFSAPMALPLTDPNVVFQAIRSFGQSSAVEGINEYYWNVSLGFDLDAFTGATDCFLDTRATATEGVFADGLVTGNTPDFASYPYVNWHIPLSTTGAAETLRLSCGGNAGDNQNPLNGTSSGVTSEYTPFSTPICLGERYPGTEVVGSVNDASIETTCVP